MALKIKKPFGPGTSPEQKARIRGRKLLEEERIRKRDFEKLRGIKSRRTGVRT